MNDPTTLEVSILAELQDGVNAKRIQKELSQFKITDIKPSNRTLNQYIFNVTLDGQSADEFLKVLRTKEYVKSAMIAPSLVEPAQNMPAGKSTKTKPIKQ